MTHPLAEFGLEEDADERAVKRAYAKRLKVTRPDEDAAAFQALNEAYQRALGFIRWRDAQGEGEAAVFVRRPAPVTRAAERTETPAKSIKTPQVADQPEEQTFSADAGEQSRDEHPEQGEDIEDIEPVRQFSFSAGDFVTEMVRGKHNRDPARLRQWLHVQMADWPLTAKPQIAYAVLSNILDNDISMRPQVFDTLIEELGLNDIHMGYVDRVTIDHHREKMEFRFGAPETVIPEAGWSKWVVPAFLGILLVFVLGGVFVGNVGRGQPAGNPTIPWYRSVGPNTDGPITLQNLTVGNERSVKWLTGMVAEENGKGSIASVLEKIMGEGEQMGLDKRRIMAAVLFKAAQRLQQADKPRAYEAYRQLQTRFGEEKDHDIALLVAASYVNMGYGEERDGNLDAAFEAFQAVDNQFGLIKEGRIGRQVFNAMYGQAGIFHSREQRQEALNKLQAIEDLFARSDDYALAQSVGTSVTYLRMKLDLGHKADCNPMSSTQVLLPGRLPTPPRPSRPMTGCDPR